MDQPHPVSEILVAGPRERLFARPIDAAEQGIEYHALDLCLFPVSKSGPQTPALEASRTLLREVVGTLRVIPPATFRFLRPLDRETDALRAECSERG
jgi:hypothetical protein